MHWLPGAQRLAQDLVGPVGDHLIRVGVRRRPGAGLEDVDHEIPVKFAFLDFLGGLLDRVGQAGLQQSKARVHQRSRPLDLGQGADKAMRHAQIADRKVLAGALGAGAVIGACGNLDLTHGIALHARVLLGHARSSYRAEISRRFTGCSATFFTRFGDAETLAGLRSGRTIRKRTDALHSPGAWRSCWQGTRSRRQAARCNPSPCRTGR